MHFSLQDLAAAVNGTLGGGASVASASISCSSIAASSRSVLPGALFVAVRGHAADGHGFVSDAFSRGASAAVVEDAAAAGGSPCIVVQNSRAALSRLAALFAGNPSDHLKVVGVTGTNGKTTTNWMVYHTLNRLGLGCLRIGTLGTECLGKGGKAGELTSPDPISIHAMLRDALREGAASCVMETSSHALDQARVADVAFDVGIFTNLTRDHLDYHGTMECYFDAKRRLFDLLANSNKKTKAAVVNVDDPYGRQMREAALALGCVDWSFGRGKDARFTISRERESEAGMEITLRSSGTADEVLLQVPFIGLHNVENAVAAAVACAALGYPLSHVAQAMAGIPQVPGRLERVPGGSVRVFVDYAHTPDALERALVAVRPSTSGKLWVVFGCGGDRDKGKRPLMAQVAERCADKIIITSDNPRTESPAAIIDDIVAGCSLPQFIEVDRRLAIEAAILKAEPGDTVLIAGKGHEDYQIIGTEKVHFSDQESAQQALQRRG